MVSPRKVCKMKILATFDNLGFHFSSCEVLNSGMHKVSGKTGNFHLRFEWHLFRLKVYIVQYENKNGVTAFAFPYTEMGFLDLLLHGIYCGIFLTKAI